MNTHEQMRDTLNAVFGQHRGLNADWAVEAWHVKGPFWILDTENDGFSLVSRTVDDDGEQTVTFLSTSPFA